MPKLFVIMPYGSKPAGERALDFDRVYFDIIEPAGKDAGLDVLRTDLVPTPGRISDQFLEALFQAEVALADVTLPNANVFYELGIRQTLGSRPTILIARGNLELPFDFRDQRVILYHTETAQQITEARQAISTACRSVLREPGQNPVQSFLHAIGASTSPAGDAAAFEQDLRGRIERARNGFQLIAVWKWAQQYDRLPALTLAALADRLAEEKEWTLAVEAIDQAIHARPKDFELYRSRGSYLRKLGNDKEAELAFKEAIELNASDPETRGLLGGLLKRQERFAEAAEQYELGSKIAPRNLYMRYNRVGMMLLANPTDTRAALELYGRLLQDLLALPSDQKDAWTECMTGEAHFVLGQDAEARKCLEGVARQTRNPDVLLSPADQFDLLAKHGYRPQEAAEMAKWLREAYRGLTAEKTATGSAAPPPQYPVILHLTDVHFGKLPGPDGTPISMHRFYDGDYSEKLVTHLVNEFTSKKRQEWLNGRPLFLIVSGDLTYTASQAEFDESCEFLEELCGSLKVPKERVIICPGNHDVNWAESKINQSRRFDWYLSFLAKFYGDELFRSLYPSIKWDFKINSERPHPSEMVSLQVFEPERLLILSLNSCMYETEEHHYGFVGGKQWQIAEKRLKAIERDDLLRVAVVHHHLHSFPEPVQMTTRGEHWQDLSAIRDAALIEKNLQKYNFDMVFHGHKHRAQLRETVLRDKAFSDTIRPMIIFGGGSCGVMSKELAHNVSNQYQIVEVLNSPRVKSADFLRVEWREIEVGEGAEWATTKTWTLRG